MKIAILYKGKIFKVSHSSTRSCEEFIEKCSCSTGSILSKSVHAKYTSIKILKVLNSG